MSFLVLLAILVVSFRYGGLLAGSYFTWLTLRKQIDKAYCLHIQTLSNTTLLKHYFLKTGVKEDCEKVEWYAGYIGVALSAERRLCRLSMYRSLRYLPLTCIVAGLGIATNNIVSSAILCLVTFLFMGYDKKLCKVILYNDHLFGRLVDDQLFKEDGSI